MESRSPSTSGRGGASPHRALRVLVITDRLSLRGGAESYLRELVELTSDDVLWHVAYGHDDATAPPLAALFATTTRVRGLEVGVPDRREARTLRGLDELLARTRPHALLVQNVVSPALLTHLAEDARTVLVVHDHRLFCPAAGKTLPTGAACEERVGTACGPCLPDDRTRDLRIELVRARLEAVRRMPRVVAASHAVGRWLAHEGVDEQRIAVAPPAVPRWAIEAPPAPPAAERALACVPGRVALHKGGVHLVRALAMAGVREPVTFVGDGPARPALEAEAAALGVPVRITGWLPASELPGVLGAHRVVVLPALWAEPFGLAGLEAAALGLPVVAPAVGGIPEWLEDGEVGVLVPPADGPALVAATRRLLGDAEAAERLGRSGAARVRALFRPEAFRATWRSVLENAARTRSGQDSTRERRATARP